MYFILSFATFWSDLTHGLFNALCPSYAYMRNLFVLVINDTLFTFYKNAYNLAEPEDVLILAPTFS